MFKNIDTFCYTGVGHAQLINRLLQANVKVISAKSSSNQLIITTHTLDRQKIIALFDELCYNYKLSKSEGIKSASLWLTGRIGLAISLIVAIVFFAILPHFILDIRVKSQFVSTDEVQKVLSEQGIFKGTYKPNKNCNEVSQALQGIKGVAFATVVRKGTTITVTLFEELPQINIFDVSGSAPISAISDAIISRQIVYSGTSAFKNGEVVKCGEVLIAGYVEVGDEKVNVSARGEVYGLVSYSSNIMYKERRIERVKSGKVKTITSMRFLGLDAGKPVAPYRLYESVATNYVGGFMVPITMQKTTYYELIDSEVFVPIGDVQEDLIKKALSVAEEKSPPN
ncbi:MAG: sporulation protein YqfD, partial [Clostridia bacterium]